MNKINTIIFDLDGTLLPMDTEAFMMEYNKLLGAYFMDIVDPNMFIKAMWQSTKETIENLEARKNYEVFKEAMKKKIDGDVDLYYKRIYEFYDDAFLKLGEYAGSSPEIVEAISVLKTKGYRLIIATNPLFPMKANHHRISWAGLSPEDFDYISCFEENHYCKPHLDFYEEVLSINNIDVNTALMVGNDVDEDLIARDLGLMTYLIEDHLLHRSGKAIETDYRGCYEDFLNFVKALKSVK